MPQGVVRDDGCLIQAQALKSAFSAPASAGGFYCLSRGTKKPGHHTRPHAQMNLSIGWQTTSKRAAIPVPQELPPASEVTQNFLG